MHLAEPQQLTQHSMRWLACTHLVQPGKTCVYEYVYECRTKSPGNGVPSRSYTHSYTPISPSPEIQLRHLG